VASEARPGGGPVTAPRLLAISDRLSAPEPIEDWLRRIGSSGVDAVQLREKDLDDRALYELAVRARALLPPEVILLVNGRPDVALAAGAGGVHLPAAGLPVPAVRSLAVRRGRRLLVGRSTHDLDEVEAALAEGADYATFGPLHETPSKRRYGPPAGLAGLARAARAGLPLVALGGIGPGELAAAAAAGAEGAAAIRAFQDPETTAGMVARAAEAFGGGARGGV